MKSLKRQRNDWYIADWAGGGGGGEKGGVFFFFFFSWVKLPGGGCGRGVNFFLGRLF